MTPSHPFLTRTLALSLIGVTAFAQETSGDFRQDDGLVTYGKEISETRSTWERDSAKIRELLLKFKHLVPTLTTLKAEIPDLEGELGLLIREKKAALDELRMGAFCTGCGKTRTQIESTGDQFPHPGQQSRPATPEELETAEKDYDVRIDRLRQQLAKKVGEQTKKKAELDSAYHEFLTRSASLDAAITKEGKFREMAWGNEREKFHESIDTAGKAVKDGSKALEAINSEMERTEGEEQQKLQAKAKAIRASTDIMRRQYSATLDRAHAAHARAAQHLKSYAQSADRTLIGLSELAAPLAGGFGVPDGKFLSAGLKQIPGGISRLVFGIDRSELAAEITQDESPNGNKVSPIKRSVEELLEGD